MERPKNPSIDVLDLINIFLREKEKNTIQSETDDLFDFMDSLDFVELVCFLDQRGVKILLPIHGVHFNFNLVQTVERLKRYIEKTERKSLIEVINDYLRESGKPSVTETDKLFSSGLLDVSEFFELVSYFETNAAYILPVKYENNLFAIDTVKEMESVIE